MINESKINELKKFENAPITSTQRNLIFGGLFIFTLAFMVMFASAILSGLAALIGVIVVGVVLFFGGRLMVAADPLIKQKTKNAVIKRMYQEAANNAIEQLSNQVLANVEKLKASREARDKMNALLKRMKSSLKPENIGKPIRIKKEETIKVIEAAYNTMCQNVDMAAEANKKFEQKVNDYREFNSFSELANEAMAYANKDDKLSDMLSTHAFESIGMEFDSAIAKIENSAKDMALDNGES